jgi:N-methylhydantoinase A
MGCTIDIDTGGTFTDGFFYYQDKAVAVKVPTTAHDLTVCFLECIKAGADRLGFSVEDLLFDTDIIRFSNTIGTNTIIQRDGSKIGLLVTQGSEDFAPTKTDSNLGPLVEPDMVLGIKEEVSSQGEILSAPDDAAVMQAAQELIDKGARCLVAAFMNSEINPDNERRIRQVVKKEYPRDYLGSVPVFLSSDVSFRSGYTARINTAVISAYIHGKLARLLYKAEEELRRYHYHGTLFIGHNNGAVARVAKTRAINTYNSGPAAGLSGAGMIGKLYGTEDLITGDMGGTSFDIGYIRDGQPSFSLETDVEGYTVNVPMLGLQAIGAGGGSIASVQNNKLQVGPMSAGALPGPVCFDLGGLEPTVTDADLVLGIVDPDGFLGGNMKLNYDKARQAIDEKIASPLGISVEQAALNIREMIDATMAQALAKMKDREFADKQPVLLVYGGAGPVHCADIARRAGIRKIIVTPFSPIFSAFASASQDVGHIYYRRLDTSLNNNTDLDSLNNVIAGLHGLAERDMRGEGFSLENMTAKLEFFVSAKDREARFLMEKDRLTGLPELLEKAQHTLGAKTNGKLVLNSLGLRTTAPVPHYPIPTLPKADQPVDQTRNGSRTIFTGPGGSPVEVPVYDGIALTHGHALNGPALVEANYTTIYVPPEWSLHVDQNGHAILEEVA